MGVYIKGMKPIQQCDNCFVSKFAKCKLCPFVDVDVPHGNMIDADALVNMIVFHTDLSSDVKEEVEDLIKDAPIIIGAEGSN